MRLVHPGGRADWALVDQDQGLLRHLAGGLAAWAPRIAFGEGRAALPINGRVEPRRPTPFLTPGRHYHRVFPALAAEGPDLLAAVIGAAPLGRPGSLRCVVGYVAVAPCRDGGAPDLGPVLVTADEFGADGPALRPPQAVGASIKAQLERRDAEHGLRTGDVVILGPATLSLGLWTALRGDGAAMAWSKAAVRAS